MPTKLETAETWFRRVWTEEDKAAIHEMFVPEEDGCGASGLIEKTLPGPDEFAEFHETLLMQFSNVKIEVVQHLEDEDWISMRVKLTAISKHTNQEVQMPGQILVKISDGKLREAHNNLDFFSFFEQSKILPAGIMERCLQGESFT